MDYLRSNISTESFMKQKYKLTNAIVSIIKFDPFRNPKVFFTTECAYGNPVYALHGQREVIIGTACVANQVDNAQKPYFVAFSWHLIYPY